MTNRGAFDRKFQKYARRCARLGLPECVIVSETADPIWHEAPGMLDGGWFEDRVKIEVRVPRLEIEGGWKVAGVIEQAGDFCLVSMAPGFEHIDGRDYIEHGMTCEHCNTKRRRSKVVLVEDIDGNVKAVGLTCLQAYCGIDPKQALEVFDFGLAYGDEDDIDADAPRGRRERATYGAAGFAGCVLARIRVDGGYKGAAVRQHGGSSTADDVQELLNADTHGMPSHVVAQVNADRVKYTPTEAEFARAEEIVATWAAIDPTAADSEFSAKLAIIARAGFVPVKFAGVIAGGVQGFLKRIEKQAEQERRAAEKAERGAPSAFVGEEGKRVEVEVEVDRVRTYENEWGLKVIVGMRIAGTNDALVWFGSGNSPQNAGLVTDEGTAAPGVHRVKLTVKQHRDDERFGKQTVVQRVSKAKGGK